MRRNASYTLKVLLLPLLLIGTTPLLAGAECNVENFLDDLFNALDQNDDSNDDDDNFWDDIFGDDDDDDDFF